MPTGLYRQTCRGRTRNRPIEGINGKKIESTGKPDFSVVYATRMEFLRTTAGVSGPRFEITGPAIDKATCDVGFKYFGFFDFHRKAPCISRF